MPDSSTKQSTGSFGVWTLAALVVGNAIGAGIYTTSGYSLASLGSPEWVLLAWMIAGLIALCGALSYGMLVQNLQESGGEYLYLSRSIHPLAGFIAGWISLLAGFPGAIAFAASALEAYARAGIPTLASAPIDSIAIGVTLAAGFIHIGRTGIGAKIHEWVVAFMLFAITVALICSFLLYTNSPQLPYIDPQEVTSFSLLNFANSLVWISLSYSGFNSAAYVAGEVTNAKVVVPRGMILGTLLTIFICVALNAVIVYSDAPTNLSGQAEIAAIAAESLGGQTARRLVEIMIAVSLLTSITAMAMAGPRVYAKMAEDGALPKLFRAKLNNPPRASIILQVVISIALIMVADLRELLSYLGITLSLCLALAVSSLFIRHWRNAEIPTSKWYPIAPFIFVVSTVVFALLSAINDIRQVYALIPTIGIGVVAYLIAKPKIKINRTGTI